MTLNSRPETEADYIPFLTLYFEEEIMGEASFRNLTKVFSEPHQQEKLILLSDIERAVAETVRPLLDRHGITPRSDDELHASDYYDLDKHKDKSWEEFMQDILVDFPGYNEDFAALENVAPEEDLPVLKTFTDHEDAGIEFAKQELAGNPGSADVLKDYLDSLTG